MVSSIEVVKTAATNLEIPFICLILAFLLYKAMNSRQTQPITPDKLRTVHLPLETLDRCIVCSKNTNLRLCSSCGETIYCSQECQTQDWPDHKLQCGKTDRINLKSFYPLLACLMEGTRGHPDKPIHPAITHKILNSPNPKDENGVCAFPDGYSSRLVILGDEISEQSFVNNPGEWWPTAKSEKIRQKLGQRFMYEGHLLPGLVAVSFALLAEMYTTTSGPEGQRRVRLKYETSPIKDFGIVKGRVEVKNQDKLSYYSVDDHKFMHGQDPEDHYWLYFTTIRGEEVLLECGMFTFNFCLMIGKLGPYLKHGLPPFTAVPGFFVDRDFRRHAPSLHQEQQRFSVLHDPDLQEAVRYSGEYLREDDTVAICNFMDKVAGRPCSSLEKELLLTWAVEHCEVLYRNIVHREYKNFPESPTLGINEDEPGEVAKHESAAEDELWFNYMKKWNKVQRSGEITTEQLGEAFIAWKDAPHETRLELSKRPFKGVRSKRKINRKL